ncbi:MAG: MaoC family dehydratase [Sphingobium sp.]
MRSNFFEDFALGQHFRHATPRTISEGDASLHIALTGARQPLPSSTPLAQALGYAARPIDDVLLFNMAFGKTVPDISFNAVANLGYADIRFLAPVYAGDTIRAESTIIGLRETSAGDSGIVHVRSDAYNQNQQHVLTWARWVLVRKNRLDCVTSNSEAPDLPASVTADRLVAPPLSTDLSALTEATGSNRLWEDYTIGQRIDHSEGMTLDESDHTLATKLYQNNSIVHFDALVQAGTRHGRRLVYGGHVISVCRALSYPGLENILSILAINGGSHRAPTFAGDTLYCYTEVLDIIEMPGRSDVGALRLRLVGLRNNPSAGFSDRIEIDGKRQFHPDVVLDLDYVALIPRRTA